MKIPEKLSYFFFKGRLKKKLEELYEMEDPWESAHLSQVFSPMIRKQLANLPGDIRRLPWLDAGGGEGHYLESLRDLIPEYHLVDINPAAAKRAGSRLGKTPGRIFRTGLDRFRPRRDAYGVVLIISTLNYLGAARHPGVVKGIVRRLGEACRSGGLIFLIHPYYSPGELSVLQGLSTPLEQLGVQVRQRESFALGRQEFWLECLQKS